MRSVAALILFTGACELIAAEPPCKIKPVVVWSGTRSAQTKELLARCSSDDELIKIWEKHARFAPGSAQFARPQIDFDTHMLVAIFHGKSDTNHGIHVAEV